VFSKKISIALFENEIYTVNVNSEFEFNNIMSYASANSHGIDFAQKVAHHKNIMTKEIEEKYLEESGQASDTSLPFYKPEVHPLVCQSLQNPDSETYPTCKKARRSGPS
jgi:hypothetical protein